jgi:5-methylcytosine-specific restriction endonuclease McrA
MTSESVPLKRCSRKANCKHPSGPYLPATLEYFHQKRASKDGLNSCCRECNKTASKTWREAYPGRMSEYMAQYRIDNREAVLEGKRADYHKNRQRYRTQQNQHYYINHEDQLDRRKKYYYANKDKVIALNARRRTAEGQFTADDIECLYTEQEGRCRYCGMTLHGEYQIDHIVPVSRNGTNWPDNLALTCAPCNMSKKDKLLHEWEAVRGW